MKFSVLSFVSSMFVMIRESTCMMALLKSFSDNLSSLLPNNMVLVSLIVFSHSSESFLVLDMSDFLLNLHPEILCTIL